MPIAFTCPHCGAQTNVDDRFAGQNGPCSHCGKLVTIPLSPLVQNPAPHPASGRFAPAGGLVGCIVCLIIAVVMAMLFMSALTAHDDGYKKAHSINNLKEIVLGLYNYESKYRSFPPAYIADADGRPMHSWRVLILPFLDQQALYDQYRFDEPWDGPKNRRLHHLMPAVYADPGLSDGSNTYTNYAVVTGKGTMFPGAKSTRLRDLRDGPSEVIAVVSIGESDIVWCEPRDLEFDTMNFRINDPVKPGIKSNHFGGAPVAFGDGRAMSLEDDTAEAELKSLILRNDGK